MRCINTRCAYPMEKSRWKNQKWVPYVEGVGIDG